MDRIFDLDAQLLFDTLLMAISIFILFTLLSYLLFKPVRKILEERQERVEQDQLKAKESLSIANALQAKYEGKLKEIDKEAQELLSEARKKAKGNEATILAEAHKEASVILERANAQVELEKKQARDDMKQEMITVASMMAGKVISGGMDMTVQESLVEETLQEIGETTWQS